MMIFMPPALLAPSPGHAPEMARRDQYRPLRGCVHRTPSEALRCCNSRSSRRSGSGLADVRIYQVPRTSDPHPDHRIYPYLLRGLSIERANQVWSTDITYIPMRRGFLYLVAIMDWWSRKVLAWRLSNTMDVDFCVEALEAALARHGKPKIFNSDQGSQFTSLAFTQALKDAGVKISMDGKGRWMDNVMIERLWRSLKYECVYLQAFETGACPCDHPVVDRVVTHRRWIPSADPRCAFADRVLVRPDRRSVHELGDLLSRRGDG